MAIGEDLIQCTNPMLEIAQTVEEVGGEELKKCYQCGTCSGVCPWGNLEQFSPRNFIDMVRLGLEGFEEATWTCVNCKMCWDRCPQQINIPQLFQSVRNILLEWGSNPSALNFALASLRSDANPWGEPYDKKTAWAAKYGVPMGTEGHEYTLFACCTNEFDARNQKDGHAVAQLLQKAGVDFGYLGNKGGCCGDMVHSVGETAIYEGLEKKNAEVLANSKVITISPHCLNSFKNRYPEDLKIESVHVAELFDQFLTEGKLAPVKDLNMKVTYHDPCYLGRYNDVYDAPRNILGAIPGVELVEMDHTRETSMCCGGGGGGAWMERNKGERLGDLRVMEALKTGASTIVTACPYCVQMLEASILGLNLDDKLNVVTISEILLDSLA